MEIENITKVHNCDYQNYVYGVLFPRILKRKYILFHR